MWRIVLAVVCFLVVIAGVTRCWRVFESVLAESVSPGGRYRATVSAGPLLGQPTLTIYRRRENPWFWQREWDQMRQGRVSGLAIQGVQGWIRWDP
jgi:hypothetical protein